jgi:hypothetical protein
LLSNYNYSAESRIIFSFISLRIISWKYFNIQFVYINEICILYHVATSIMVSRIVRKLVKFNSSVI